MDILTKTKTNIDELNQRFFLILENFVPNYISYLKEPSNTLVANEIQHVKSVVNKIHSDGFMLKNSMDSAIQTSQQVSRQQNIEIEKLKVENGNLSRQAKRLENKALTSEGLYDQEIEWYRLQIKVIFVMLIGIIICVKVFYNLQPTTKEIILLFGVIFIISIFEYVYMYLYRKIKANTNKNKK